MSKPSRKKINNTTIVHEVLSTSDVVKRKKQRKRKSVTKKPTISETCCWRISPSSRNSFMGRTCGKPAKYSNLQKHYCKTHYNAITTENPITYYLDQIDAFCETSFYKRLPHDVRSRLVLDLREVLFFGHLNEIYMNGRTGSMFYYTENANYKKRKLITCTTSRKKIKINEMDENTVNLEADGYSSDDDNNKFTSNNNSTGPIW